jgi:hypothetical protein
MPRFTALARCSRGYKAGRLTYVGQPSRLASRTPQQTTGGTGFQPSGWYVPATVNGVDISWGEILDLSPFPVPELGLLTLERPGKRFSTFDPG